MAPNIIRQPKIAPRHAIFGISNIKGDGGLMFASAIVVLFCCMSILVLHKTDLEAELN